MLEKMLVYAHIAISEAVFGPCQKSEVLKCLILVQFGVLMISMKGWTHLHSKLISLHAVKQQSNLRLNGGVDLGNQMHPSS